MSTALVVGLGHMGSFHRDVLTKHLGYTVTTVDPDPSRGADYATIAEACLPRDYDVAVVAAPAERLVECAFELAGTPLLVEKPFATNVRDATMLAAYLDSRKAPVAVDFTERFNPRLVELREHLQGREIVAARFTRWSVKPSWNVGLDLLVHDIDLAYHLGLVQRLEGFPGITYDTRADAPRNVRRIEVDTADGQMFWANLLDHGKSPLTILWHNFLINHPYTPRPAHAVRALKALAMLPAQAEVPA
jgi:predicted dehydrogenase